MPPRYNAHIHSGVVRQSASILSIQLLNKKRGGRKAAAGATSSGDAIGGGDVMRTGSRARVRFRFLCFAEYLLPGATVLMREGSAKGVGRITRML